MLAWYDG